MCLSYSMKMSGQFLLSFSGSLAQNVTYLAPCNTATLYPAGHHMATWCSEELESLLCTFSDVFELLHKHERSILAQFFWKSRTKRYIFRANITVAASINWDYFGPWVPSSPIPNMAEHLFFIHGFSAYVRHCPLFSAARKMCQSVGLESFLCGAFHMELPVTQLWWSLRANVLPCYIHDIVLPELA